MLQITYEAIKTALLIKSSKDYCKYFQFACFCQLAGATADKHVPRYQHCNLVAKGKNYHVISDKLT